VCARNVSPYYNRDSAGLRSFFHTTVKTSPSKRFRYVLPRFQLREILHQDMDTDEGAAKNLSWFTHDFGEDSDGDIILRSSNEECFKAHQLILSLASPIFKDMFSVPQPHTLNTELPIIETMTPSLICYSISIPLALQRGQ